MNLQQFEEMKRPTMKLDKDQLARALKGLDKRVEKLILDKQALDLDREVEENKQNKARKSLHVDKL